MRDCLLVVAWLRWRKTGGGRRMEKWGIAGHQPYMAKAGKIQTYGPPLVASLPLLRGLFTISRIDSSCSKGDRVHCQPSVAKKLPTILSHPTILLPFLCLPASPSIQRPPRHTPAHTLFDAPANPFPLTLHRSDNIDSLPAAVPATSTPLEKRFRLRLNHHRTRLALPLRWHKPLSPSRLAGPLARLLPDACKACPFSRTAQSPPISTHLRPWRKPTGLMRATIMIPFPCLPKQWRKAISPPGKR